MTTEETALRRWIDAVDRLTPESHPDREQLRAVAVELGLPEDVVELAERRAGELRREAEELTMAGQHHEARRRLQQAVELVPWSEPMRTALASHRLPAARLPWAAAALGLLVVVGGAAWLARPSVGPAPIPRTTRPPLPAGPAERMLPLRVVGELPEGAALSTDALYTAYISQGSWNVRAGVQLVAGNEAIDHAHFTVRIVDGDGVITTQALALIGDSDPAVYTGERAVEDVLILSEVPRLPTGFELVVDRVSTVPGSSSALTPMPVDGLPEGVGVVAHRRRAECRPHFQDRAVCEGVFVIENTGPAALDRLKLRAHLPGGQHDDTWVVASGDLLLAPGDRQPVLFIEIFDGPVPSGDWRIEAVQARTP